ncbi:hypothetical protein HHK36_032513 [Tetracentron sinense]|uniref:Uncharacterized protein n=1 Tax=Tetracentron sinense TaxID=13715 RepID=A0A834Y914_TETSI|nr:hypothetical protein HHK36_032513 [Tetracentron sinense]
MEVDIKENCPKSTKTLDLLWRFLRVQQRRAEAYAKLRSACCCCVLAYVIPLHSKDSNNSGLEEGGSSHRTFEASGTEEAEADAEYDSALKEAIRGVQDAVTNITEHLEEVRHEIEAIEDQ